MPESKLGEKWMYYDWSRVDRCFPLSVRLSLFVQGEISSWRRSTQLFHLSFIWTAKSASLSSRVPFLIYSFIYLFYLCLSLPVWRNCQSTVTSIQWNNHWTEVCHRAGYLVMLSRRPGRHGLRSKLQTLLGVYKCGLLTLLGGGKSIYSLWKFYQS